MTTIALIDADAFYASVFKVFIPKLASVPVVVLSVSSSPMPLDATAAVTFPPAAVLK